MTLLKKIQMEKITSKNTKRALRNKNAKKTTVLLSHLRNNYAFIVGYCCSVAARGENDWEGCEISSLVEHIGLSPWLFSGVSSHSGSPNPIKLIIFSCPYSNPNPKA